MLPTPNHALRTSLLVIEKHGRGIDRRFPFCSLVGLFVASADRILGSKRRIPFARACMSRSVRTGAGRYETFLVPSKRVRGKGRGGLNPVVRVCDVGSRSGPLR